VCCGYAYCLALSVSNPTSMHTHAVWDGGATYEKPYWAA
jgi:hypothetical protein